MGLLSYADRVSVARGSTFSGSTAADSGVDLKHLIRTINIVSFPVFSRFVRLFWSLRLEKGRQTAILLHEITRIANPYRQQANRAFFWRNIMAYKPFSQDNLWEVIENAQNAIIRKYASESSIARKMALKELENIASGDKSDDEKIREIRSRFPISGKSGLDMECENEAPSQDRAGQERVGMVCPNCGTFLGQKNICPICGKTEQDTKLENRVFSQDQAGQKRAGRVCPNCGTFLGQKNICPVCGRPELDTGDDDFEKGRNAFHSGQHTATFNSLLREAEQGNADAQFKLGYRYFCGNGVERDDTEAVKWFQLAAEQGEAQAQLFLAYCYDNGQGIRQDEAEAIKWLKSAAERGYAGAQIALGLKYYSGRGVDENMTEAVKWFHLAAEQGDSYAQCELGCFYYNGTGVTKNTGEARKWLSRSAAQGYDDARRLLNKLIF